MEGTTSGPNIIHVSIDHSIDALEINDVFTQLYAI